VKAFSRPRAIIIAVLALLIGANQAAAQDQEVVKGTYGDWKILCAEAQNVCVMQQTGKGTEGNDVLEVRIRKLEGVKTEDGTAVPAAIQIAAPLGVLLRPGIKVKVDSGEPRAGAFEICIAGGCLVRDFMMSEFLNAMKRGQTAKMTVVSPQHGEIPVDISLRGFTAAFNALTP